MRPPHSWVTAHSAIDLLMVQPRTFPHTFPVTFSCVPAIVSPAVPPSPHPYSPAPSSLPLPPAPPPTLSRTAVLPGRAFSSHSDLHRSASPGPHCRQPRRGQQSRTPTRHSTWRHLLARNAPGYCPAAQMHLCPAPGGGRKERRS